MSSQYSVLHPNYRGTKKFNVLASTQILVESDFNEYKGNKLSNRNAYIKYGDKFNRLMVQLDGEETLLEVKETSYTVRKKNYSIAVIDVLFAFDVFANSAEEAAEKIRRTLEGDVVLNNFTLMDADTSRMEFDCDILLYEFSHEYLMKEITVYDEAPKKYEQLASLKVLVKGVPDAFFNNCNFLYRSECLLDNYDYKIDNFNLTIKGLKKTEYELLPVSFKKIDDDLTEFTFAFNFVVYGYSAENTSDAFESIYTPDNTTISDFTFIDDENFITTEFEVIEIIDTVVEEVAEEYGQ
ncbi:hypothetical protein QH639_14960 [Lysinibacillus sp. 1 U-2021]|uniref:hypothetical protein n=1 Tax=Lysinibacillus sp. 1 U-2021 TaxID=3039426 RepID=UPI00247FA757|nr:hypothetical protein [Lysinibacillus sp. 1 U-2021]WGT37146.1 hypothetical protein QH639_14960 [Lysinibacillus sp. 1 U-2021]